MNPRQSRLGVSTVIPLIIVMNSIFRLWHGGGRGIVANHDYSQVLGEFTSSQTLTAQLKLSSHKTKFLKASSTLRLREGPPKPQRDIWSTYTLLITVGLYAH